MENKLKTSFIDNDTEYFIIESENEVELESLVTKIKDFMSSNIGKGKADDEKDKLYKESQLLWKDYSNALRKTKYNFTLNKKQFKFLSDLIVNKMEYYINTIFFAIELTEMMNLMSTAKFDNDNQLIAFPVNATEITYVYHLISTYKVKGLKKDSYTFSEILLKIGDISKIVNYYDILSKNLSADIQDWAAAFEDGVNLEPAKIAPNS